MDKQTTVAGYLEILGHRVKDKVTGMTGIATSVGFDLYGCVQVIVNRGVGKDGKVKESQWFDFNRLSVTSAKPVMEIPQFIANEKRAPQLTGPENKDGVTRAL